MDANWISRFLEAMGAERAASENTLLAYGRDLKDFRAFLTVKNSDFETAGRPEIETYLTQLRTRGIAHSTLARRLSSIKQLYRFAFEEDWRNDNPAQLIKGPKKKRKLPDTLTEIQVRRLLEAASKTGRNPLNVHRNTCLMHLLYATGMRVSELVSLPVASVRGQPDMILIKGKGGKERLVPLSPPAKMTLAAYLKQRDRHEDLARTKSGTPASPFLFGSSSAAGHMTRVRFYTLIKEISVNAGVDPSKVSPHTLRHAFATHLLANGADLRVIQTLLGHADVATTEIYTHVLDEKLMALVQNHHPLAKARISQIIS